MLYTKSKNSYKIGYKAMQKWGIKGEVLTLVDLHKQCSSWFFERKTSQELQEQLPSTSVAKVRCNGGCLCAIIRPNTHLYTKERERYRDGGYANPNPNIKALWKNVVTLMREKRPPLIELTLAKLLK